MELPSLPKKNALNILIILAFALFTLTAVVTLITLGPKYGKIIEVEGGKVNIDFAYPSAAQIGSTLDIMVTLSNEGGSTVNNLIIEIVNDDNFVGQSVVVPKLLPSTTKKQPMKIVIKPSATPGTASMTGKLTAENAVLSEQKLSIRLVPNLQAVTT